MSEAIVEKGPGRALQTPAVHLTRSMFRFWDPSAFSPEQWRIIAREPVNKMAQNFLKRELAALDWEIVSNKKNDPRIDKYIERWDEIFEDGAGYLAWMWRTLDDVMCLTFGAASEVGYKGKDLEWIQHVDAATLRPTYDKKRPVCQVNPDNYLDQVFFTKDQLVRFRYNPRPEIHLKEYQMSPTEEALLPIEALSKIYLYYMQELTDTPAMGILDVMDMTQGEAVAWAKNFREMMEGTDPLKIPILYDHQVPAQWIPFNRSPADLNIPDLFKRFAELLLGKYGLSIGDLRLFEHESTKAGERVSQMVTERSGVGFWAALMAHWLTRLLPDGLEFKFKQPRPEREKIVAERKAVQLAALQAAAANKQLISVKDAVEEAQALEIFTTEVTPKEEKEQSDIFGAAGPEGGPPGAKPDFGTQTEEDLEAEADKDLSKAMLEVKAYVLKALGADWRHPDAPATERLEALFKRAFARSGEAVDPGQVAEIQDVIQAALETLEDAEVKATLQRAFGGTAPRPGDNGQIIKTSLTDAAESTVHRAWTVLFDRLFMLGYIDRDTRIKASGLIGKILPEMSEDLLELLQGENTQLKDDDLRIFAKALIQAVEKGGSGSGNWAHAGRPGSRGGSAPGGGLAQIGAVGAHSRAERQAMSRRTRQAQGWISGKTPTSAGMRATIGAKLAARKHAESKRTAMRAGKQAVGEETEAFGQDPTKRYKFVTKVVSLDTLTVSNKPSGEINPDYDQDLQPRLRDRAASEMQVDKIAKNLVPEAMLWDFHLLDRGSPIIGGDRMVESGNGRVMALRRAQEMYPERFAAYQEELKKSAAAQGVDPADFANIDNPVLVRERVTDVDRADFAKETNEASVLQMSPLEKARSDSTLISDASLSNLTVTENQSIDQALRTAANSNFVKTFVGALPANEAAGIIRGDGTLNRMGLWRVKAALFSKTFPGDAGDRLADTFFESVDHTTRNFENAIGDVLPALARAEGLIASGQRSPELSLSNDISRAIDMHARLKEINISPRDYVAQTTLWDRELTSNQETLLVAFGDNSRSRVGIRGMLSTYADAVISAPNPNQAAMFGGSGLSAQDVIDRMVGAATGKSLALDQALAIVNKMLEKGGPGSGNFAHAGRPGARGGSAPGGGRAAAGAGAQGSAGAKAAEAKRVTSEAKRLYAAAKKVEPAITQTVTGVVGAHGGEMEGLEFRLKTQSSLESKIRRYQAEDSLGAMTPEEAAKKVTDSVRYTAIFGNDEMVTGTLAVQSALAKAGWTKYDHKFKNYFGPGDQYDGYNCVFENKGLGLKMELQFHTRQSVAIKHVGHEIYMASRELPNGPEKAAADARMTALWVEGPDYQKPTGWETLPGVMMHPGAQG